MNNKKTNNKPEDNTQAIFDFLQIGKALHNAVKNNQLQISEISLQNFIPFIAYSGYVLGLKENEKDGE